MKQSVAISGSRPAGQAPAGLDGSRFDPGEAWRPALVAFYERDEQRMRAAALKSGLELSWLDRQVIKAIQAAVEAAP